MSNDLDLPKGPGVTARTPAAGFTESARSGSESEAPTLRVTGASKRFGTTQAVTDASLFVRQGELVGVAGHNGAGKSTLLNIVTGRLRADAGTVEMRGMLRDASRRATDLGRTGVRVVHQELSLAPALRVDETAAVMGRAVGGVTWRRNAWRQAKAVLDQMFPDHGLRPNLLIRDLSLSRRQMIECACAMLPGREAPALLILDEPTSSLDSVATEAFYAFLRHQAENGLSAVVTTHRLNEMVDHLDRIYVMRDGRVIGEQHRGEATKESLVRAMGVAADDGASLDAELTGAATVKPHRAPDPVSGDVRAAIWEHRDGDGEPLLSIELRGGELIGLAGLEGHGQLQVLEALSRSAETRRKGAKRTAFQRVKINGSAAYVSGDRRVRGIFHSWSFAKNVSVSNLRSIARGGVVSPGAELRLVLQWRDRLSIKGSPHDPILSLSGGTQQKALMARALSTESDVLLLEDPTRGVDQSTKEDVYALLREQAAQGKCVIWYSTENEELRRCDRVIVFRGGRVVGILAGTEASEAAIITHSFAGSD